MVGSVGMVWRLRRRSIVSAFSVLVQCFQWRTDSVLNPVLMQTNYCTA